MNINIKEYKRMTYINDRIVDVGEISKEFDKRYLEESVVFFVVFENEEYFGETGVSDKRVCDLSI